MFDDPETSALIQQEAADNNIIYLNVLPGGANAFCTKYEFTDLASLVANCGSFDKMDAAIFEALRFQVTAVGPGDCYDALQRGLIDATQMGLPPWFPCSGMTLLLTGLWTAPTPRVTLSLPTWIGGMA